MRPAMLLFALSLAAAPGGQEIPTIRVPVRLVTLPVLVFSQENRLLAGLQANDFRVLDRGRMQKVTLEVMSAPLSIALAIQANQDVREYLPFIFKTGSALDALLVGESGEVAVLTYGSEARVVKPFESGDIASVLRGISAAGKPARMIDAAIKAIALLAQRPPARARVLLIVGQPMDTGSESNLASVREAAQKQDVTVYCLTLPEFGKAFVSDTFSLQGAKGGGFQAGVDLGKLVSVLNRGSRAETGTDPFSVLTAATGGTQLHFRKQRQFEEAIAVIGIEIRSAYLLSYYPDSAETGFHNITVEVDVSGAKVYARPGYWLTAD
jgi:VWFA-related protein